MMIIWCMAPEIRSAMDIIFCLFWDIFCLFNPLTTRWTIKMLKKWKNTWRYHITKVYQKSLSYAIHLACDWWFFFFHFGLFFAFYTPSNPKNQNLKKKKKHYHFTQKYQISDCMMYTVPEIWFMIDRWMEKLT